VAFSSSDALDDNLCDFDGVGTCMPMLVEYADLGAQQLGRDRATQEAAAGRQPQLGAASVRADLDEPVIDEARQCLVVHGLVEISSNGRGPELRLTSRGRFLGGAVTAELLSA